MSQPIRGQGGHLIIVPFRIVTPFRIATSSVYVLPCLLFVVPPHIFALRVHTTKRCDQQIGCLRTELFIKLEL